VFPIRTITQSPGGVPAAQPIAIAQPAVSAGQADQPRIRAALLSIWSRRLATRQSRGHAA